MVGFGLYEKRSNVNTANLDADGFYAKSRKITVNSDNPTMAIWHSCSSDSRI